MNVTSEREPVITDRPLLSISRVKLFMRCPLAFAYRYIEQLPSPYTSAQLLGKSCHKALELFLRERISPMHTGMSLRNMLDACSTEFDTLRQQEEVVFAEGEDPQELKIQGLELLTLYFNSELTHLDPAYVEQRFEFELPDSEFSFCGYWDCLTKDRKVIDFKVVKKSVSAVGDLQLLAYDLAYRITSGGKIPSELALHCLVKTKQAKLCLSSTKPHTDEQLSRLTKMVSVIGTAMKSGTYYPCENVMFCAGCSYKEKCKKWPD